jgi:hypothetical protein
MVIFRVFFYFSVVHLSEMHLNLSKYINYILCQLYTFEKDQHKNSLLIQIRIFYIKFNNIKSIQ